MHKLWAVARREYGAMVATKAFLLSLTLMPLLMFGGIIAANRLGKSVDVSDHRIVIADGTGGELFADLQQAAETRNAAMVAAGDGSDDGSDDAGAQQSGPRYILQRHAEDQLDDAARLALSDRVRDGEIKAFVEIPKEVLDDGADAAIESPSADRPPPVKYYAPAAMFADQRSWLDATLNDAVRARRFRAMNLDPAVVSRATARVPVDGRGLVKQLSGGRIAGGDPGQSMTAVFVPFGFMMLMFMIIMLSAQPLLESVMEEKSSRVAEMLLGSVNSFQLMLGKLLGNVGGSLSIVAFYAAGGYVLAWYNNWTDFIPWDLAPWFIVFQVLAVLLFGSLFMAVGAAVTQLKEAQTLLLPVWILMCSPMFVWLQVVKEPNGALATGMSFFPPSTPMVMVLRLASEEILPAWQIAASLALLVAAAAAITYVAARIFRVGMLWQGKTPKLPELVRWAFSG